MEGPSHDQVPQGDGRETGETGRPRRKILETLSFEGPLTERPEPTDGQICLGHQLAVRLLLSAPPCSGSRQPGVAGHRRKALNMKDRSKASRRKDVEETQ